MYLRHENKTKKNTGLGHILLLLLRRMESWSENICSVTQHSPKTQDERYTSQTVKKRKVRAILAAISYGSVLKFTRTNFLKLKEEIKDYRLVRGSDKLKTKIGFWIFSKNKSSCFYISLKFQKYFIFLWEFDTMHFNHIHPSPDISQVPSIPFPNNFVSFSFSLSVCAAQILMDVWPSTAIWSIDNGLYSLRKLILLLPKASNYP